MKEPPSGGSRKGPPPIVFLLLGIGALWLLFTQLPKLLGPRSSLPAIPAGASLPGGGGIGIQGELGRELLRDCEFTTLPDELIVPPAVDTC
jgi:hypothetical protein